MEGKLAAAFQRIRDLEAQLTAERLAAAAVPAEAEDELRARFAMAAPAVVEEWEAARQHLKVALFQKAHALLLGLHTPASGSHRMQWQCENALNAS